MKPRALPAWRDEDGAQTIEYALLVGVISITLVLGISALPAPVCDFTGRVTQWLGELQGACPDGRNRGRGAGNGNGNGSGGGNGKGNGDTQGQGTAK